MNLFNSALGRNITLMHPKYFIISGFIGIPHIKYYYVCLFFSYVVTVLGNTIVMALIILDHNLRTPKYVVVFNLALVDVLGSSSVVPKLLDIILFNHRNIAFNDCMTLLFFCYTCFSMQTLNLAALAYDRLVAIIFPLHYVVQVTHRFMLSLIAFSWLFTVTIILTAVGLLTRLSFCNSVVINSYYCDHGQIYQLACNDNSPSVVITFLFVLLYIWLPFVFIVFSYLYIGYALSKVATAVERVKALKTCSGHLSLVGIYFIPALVLSTFGGKMHPNARIINLSLNAIFPAMLNPIIYVLQTQEIKESLKKLFKNRIQPTIKVRKV
ncbi:olfactory receptor 1E16-like [Brachionichthys hirsutus]|uniref:olfactory receptor 1E16-like n=1 Tax=Brachionichthys hirsutus TaxID=412623 RepID=UPI003604EEFD